jgi:hypothetical protein
MYWNSNDDLWRSNLDGSAREILVPGGGPVSSIALDVADGKMYWTIYGASNDGKGEVRRANLDGTGQEFLVQNFAVNAAIALDVAHGQPGDITLDLGVPGTAVFYALAAPASVRPGPRSM